MVFNWFKNFDGNRTDPGYFVPSPQFTWTVTETTHTIPRPYIHYSPARPGKRWKK